MATEPPSNRRAYTRYEIWFPVTLRLGSREVWGICRDASPKGLLMSCTVALNAGDEVSATFRVTAEGVEHDLSGRVVRIDVNPDELHLAFPFRLAVEFDQAEAGLEDRLRKSLAP